MIYDARGLTLRYDGADRDAVHGVDLQVPRGAFYAIIGPNGCGKTTLLRLLLGALQPDAGEVRYGGRLLTEWDRRELARRIGVVPQSEELVFPLSVRELVAMGRYPHLGTWRSESDVDRRSIRDAMATCDVARLAARPVGTLSGGERQRTRVARALAQDPDTLVLDEPTASLDIRHEMAIFELLRGLADGGVTVVIVTHNLNVAARYADRLLLLDEGHTAAEGEPSQVFTRDTLESVYQWPLGLTSHPASDDGRTGRVSPAGGIPQIVPLRTGESW